MGALVDRLQKQAARLGLTLTRREIKDGSLVEGITYAVLSSAPAWEEQALGEEQVIMYITLRKMEGQSTVCEAYVKLSKLKIKFEQKILNWR